MYSKRIIRFGRFSVPFHRTLQYASVFNGSGDGILFVRELQNEVGYKQDRRQFACMKI